VVWLLVCGEEETSIVKRIVEKLWGMRY